MVTPEAVWYEFYDRTVDIIIQLTRYCGQGTYDNNFRYFGIDIPTIYKIRHLSYYIEWLIGGDSMNRLKDFLKKPIGKALLVFFIILIAAGISVPFIMGYNPFKKASDKVYSECTVEAGVAVKPEDFLKEPIEGIKFANSDSLDTTIPGEYDLELTDGTQIYNTRLIIQDTIPPTGKGIECVVGQGDEITCEDFVTDITDATKVTLSFEKDPDTSVSGDQKVNIILTDLGGNQTTVEGKLTVSLVNPQITIEVGDELPTASMFAQNAGRVQLLSDVTDIDTTHVGLYPIKIKVDEKDYDVSIKVVDTVAPVVTFKDVNSFTKVNRKPEDFIEEAQDISTLTYSFLTPPDINKVGEQKVTVVVKDEGNNENSKELTLTLKEDTDYPVIEGVSDITIAVGHNVQYKLGVKVTDECEEGLSLSVDNSKVNTNVGGTYEVIYTARDAAGHETTAKCNLIVKERVYSLEEVNSMADSVLARIISPGMSNKDKAKAIFDYVRTHVAYISHSEKGNYIRGAYEGLADGKGDCYVYACTSKALLTRAGVPNCDIAKIPAKTSHYWNLVDVGTGWLHFDTTPRKDHPIIFLWDDPTMMAYSQKHWNSHNYDHSIYPIVSGSSEGTLYPMYATTNTTPDQPNPEDVANDPALAQYYAALEEQKRLEEQAAAQEAVLAQQEAQQNAELLAQYQAALQAQNEATANQ